MATFPIGIARSTTRLRTIAVVLPNPTTNASTCRRLSSIHIIGSHLQGTNLAGLPTLVLATLRQEEPALWECSAPRFPWGSTPGNSLVVFQTPSAHNLHSA